MKEREVWTVGKGEDSVSERGEVGREGWGMGRLEVGRAGGNEQSDGSQEEMGGGEVRAQGEGGGRGRRR